MEPFTYNLETFSPPGHRVALLRQKCRSGGEQMLHRHDFTEIVLIRGGCGVTGIDAVNYPTVTGDVLVIQPGSTHCFFSSTELRWYNLMFRFAELFAPEELEMFSASPVYRQVFVERRPPGGAFAPLRFSPLRFRRMTDLMEQLAGELEKTDSAAALNAKALVTLIVNEVCRIAPAAEVPAPERGDGAHELLSSILEFVNRNFTGRIDAASIAAHAGISANYLSEFFRLHTGTPLVRYINSLRVEYAQYLLDVHPEWSISEVSARCGFRDSCYFTRCYRAITRETPSQYRRRD